MLKINKRIFLLLFFVVLLGSGIAIGSSFVQDRTTDIVLSPRTLEQFIPVILKIEETVYKIRVKPNSSVYDAMAKAQETLDLRFDGREFSGLGFLVEEINGVRQSPRTREYWIYYINDKKANIGISAYMLQKNDVILWKYEKEYE